MGEVHHPFFKEDRHVEDYLLYDREQGFATFDVHLETSVGRILKAIMDRGGLVEVAFVKKPLFADATSTCISLMQDLDTKYHGELWFGENVAYMMAGGKYIHFYSLPRNGDVWQVLRLPISNPEVAFRLAVDICIKVKQGYNAHYWRNIKCGFCKMVMRKRNLPRQNDEYDPERPDTWQGVHCSQLVLLFIRRCIIHGVLPASPEHRELIFSFDSHTFLPKHLYDLIHLVWGVRDVEMDMPKLFKHGSTWQGADGSIYAPV